MAVVPQCRIGSRERRVRPSMPSAYITAASAFYPGDPVDNEHIDEFIAPIDAKCLRIKRRILAENGIEHRHYALDTRGRSTQSVAGMARQALQAALEQLPPAELDFLAAATTGSDGSVPGLANMLHGDAKLPPLKTASLSGVCASSISALDYAVKEIECGQARRAAVVASEFPSRLLKRSRLAQARELSFDAHFLRWMLSDGAGAWVLQDRPAATGLSLRVDFVHLKSFSGDYPTCMQVGYPPGDDGTGYLDFDSLAEAEAAGAYFLRQDIRLLPNLFDVGIHEYSELVRDGRIRPAEIDHFLGHYSSQRFRGVMQQLMEKAGLMIPPERWYSNLTQRGNMGSASIVTMLADFLATGRARAGEKLLLFVPESGRFTVGYVGLTVVGAEAAPVPLDDDQDGIEARWREEEELAPPVVEHDDARVAAVLQDLLGVWHGYRSDVLRSELAGKVFDGRLTRDDYCRWMAGWIGQVREGAKWMRSAASNLPPSLSALAALIEVHAGEEQNDWQVLHRDYLAAGGTVRNPDELRRNPGAEALNAYMHRVARSRSAYGLLGAVYIIEGTGNRIVPTLLPRIRAALGEGLNAYRFLEYHGENDVAHMQRWLMAVQLCVAEDPLAGAHIVRTAREVAQLYALSWAHGLDPQD